LRKEERLRNRSWYGAAGGKYKGQIYGIENVDPYDESVESFMCQTQASSSNEVDFEHIHELKQQLSTSEDQICLISLQFQSVLAFIGAFHLGIYWCSPS